MWQAHTSCAFPAHLVGLEEVDCLTQDLAKISTIDLVNYEQEAPFLSLARRRLSQLQHQHAEAASRSQQLGERLARLRQERAGQAHTQEAARADAQAASQALDTVAVKRINANTVERSGKVAGKIVETATRTVSADGKTLTIVTKGNLDGTEYSSTQVYEKQ